MTLDQATLRPLSMGQLLDRAVRIYRRNFLGFIGIIAVTQIPMSMVAIIVNLFTLGEDVPTDLGVFDVLSNVGVLSVSAIFLFLLGLVLTQIATAAVTRAIANTYLGRPSGILDSYRQIGRSWLTLLGALIVAGLVVVLIVLWWLLVPILGWFTGLGLLIFFGSAVIPLIAPVVVLEDQTAGSAWRRAWDIARRRFWWVLGFVILLSIFGQIVVTVPTLLTQFVVGAVIDSANSLLLGNILSQITQLLGNLIYLPIFLTAVTLLYFDLRVRYEGFDLAVLAAAAGEKGDAVEDLTRATAPAGTGSLITWTELGYAALVTIALAALYILLIVVVGIIFIGLGGF